MARTPAGDSINGRFFARGGPQQGLRQADRYTWCPHAEVRRFALRVALRRWYHSENFSLIGRFGPQGRSRRVARVPPQVNAVLNSIAAGRRLAVHIVVWQLGVSLLAAVVFLLTGDPWSALAAFLGGAIVALGTTLFAWRAFAGGHASAGTTMGRLVLGTAMKWVVIIGGFCVLIALVRLPPLPALVGMIAALAVHLASLRFKD